MNKPHEFVICGSDTLYVGKILALRLDQVIMPGGREAKREVVEHLGSVVILPLHDDGTVTMIDQYRHALGRRLRELPAGLLDAPGEDPLATAQRELLEEAGYVAQHWSVLVDLVSSPGFSDESQRVFLARGLTQAERPPSVEEEADLDVVRLPLDDAVRQVLTGEIVNGPAVAGLLAAYAVLAKIAQPRPANSPWPDRPTRFASRRQ